MPPRRGGPKEQLVRAIGVQFGTDSAEYKEARHALSRGSRTLRRGMSVNQAILSIKTSIATGGRDIPKSVQVNTGQNLASIAQFYFGSERAVPFIIAQNPGKFSFKADGSIDTTVFTGQSLNLPSSFDPDARFDTRLADALGFGDEGSPSPDPDAPSTDSADLDTVQSNSETFQDQQLARQREVKRGPLAGSVEANREAALAAGGIQLGPDVIAPPGSDISGPGILQEFSGASTLPSRFTEPGPTGTAAQVQGQSLTPDFKPKFEGQYTGPVTRGWLTEEQQIAQFDLVGRAFQAGVLPERFHVQTAVAYGITSAELMSRGFVRSAAGFWEFGGAESVVESGEIFTQDEGVEANEDGIFSDAEEVLSLAQAEQLSQEDRYNLFDILRTELRRIQRTGDQKSLRPRRAPRTPLVPPRFSLPSAGTSNSARDYGYIGSAMLDSRMSWS